MAVFVAAVVFTLGAWSVASLAGARVHVSSASSRAGATLLDHVNTGGAALVPNEQGAPEWLTVARRDGGANHRSLVAGSIAAALAVLLLCFGFARPAASRRRGASLESRRRSVRAPPGALLT